MKDFFVKNGVEMVRETFDNGTIIEQEIMKSQTEIQLTEQQILMQTLSDWELRSIEEQKDRQLLAQQVSDLELIILGGATNV